MLFAAAEYKVRLYDIEPSQVDDAISNIKSQLEHLEEIGLMRGHLTVTKQFQAIEGTNDFNYCVEGAVYIQVIKQCGRCCIYTGNKTVWKVLYIYR